jgi:Flp pilus assembly protein TadD
MVFLFPGSQKIKLVLRSARFARASQNEAGATNSVLEEGFFTLTGWAMTLLVLFWVFAAGQLVAAHPVQEGGIKGSVKDSTGQPVVNATVTLTRRDGNVSPPATTSANGQYEIKSLVPETYVICTEATGFQESQREGIVVTGDETTVVDFTLTPAAASPLKAGPEAAGTRTSKCQPAFFDDSELQAAGFSGSVDPSGYSASAEAQTRGSLIEGATDLRTEANPIIRGQSAPTDGSRSKGVEDAKLEQYRRVFQADPNDQHRYDLGVELLLHGDIASALELFKEGVADNSRSAKLWVGLGIALYCAGHAEDAVRAFLSATDLNATDPRPYLFLGKAYDISNNSNAEVNTRLARWVQLAPQDSRARYYYAMSLWKGNRRAGLDQDRGKIESLLRKSASLDPAFPLAHFQLGSLYSDANRLPEAIAEYQRAVTLKSDWADAHYRLGQVFMRAGNKKSGQEELGLYERLRGKQPENRNLDRGRQFLGSTEVEETTKSPPN